MKRRAFTLIELLVVLAITAVLLALIAPSIQKARQDARSRQCINNLKMLGLALHNYHDVFNSFPPAWCSRDGAIGSGPAYGWQASLLPYLDQAAMYNQFDFRTQPKKDRITQTAIKELRCPADSMPATNPLRGEFATSNYSGNYGFNPIPRAAPLGLSDSWPGQVVSPMRSNGLFARNSRIGIRDITDGTSNTFMAGERGISSGAAIWVGVTDDAHEDDAVTDCSPANRINAGLGSFSSRHPGDLANFVLGDGSVRSIKATIDSQGGQEIGTYQRLAGRNDGFVVGEF